MKQVASRLTLVFVILSLLAPVAFADVLLSELCDPRNDYLTDRYIEIWNSGPDAVDITGWRVVAVGNGGEIFTWVLSGTMDPGEVLVCGDSSTADFFPVDFPLAAWSDNNATWNGKIDDGARLKNPSNVTIDEVVAPGVLFENMHLVRNEGVTTPSTSFNAAQWTSAAVDLPSEATPGYHHTIPSAGPTIGAITALPASPLPGETVEIQAVVSDDENLITGVTLHWGTTSGSLSNVLGMANLGTGTFQTISPIPGQANGTTVYYSVTAENDLPLQTVSGEQSYLTYLDVFSPVVTDVLATGPTSVQLTFNEDLDPASAGTIGNYTLAGGSVTAAVVEAPHVVTLTVSFLANGNHSLTVDGVEDLLGNATSSLLVPFTYNGGNIPSSTTIRRSVTRTSGRPSTPPMTSPTARCGTCTRTCREGRPPMSTPSAPTRVEWPAPRGRATTASIPGRRAGTGPPRPCTPTCSWSSRRTTT
jgi:hypothetical protein